MTDPELISVATGVASTLIADMVRGGAVSARAALVGLLRRTPQQGQTDALLALEQGDAVALAQALADQATLDSHVMTRLHAMAATAPRVQIQRNEGSGTFIGGDIFGDLTINEHQRR